MDYSNSDPTTATSADDPSESPDTDKGAEDQEYETSALVPKSILGSKLGEFKVGDEVVFKIDAMHEDDLEISYATGKSESKDEGSTMDKAKAGIDKYASEPSGDM